MTQTNPEGTYDADGRRLDKVPVPPAEAAAAFAGNALPQQIYVTAQPLRKNDYVVSDSTYVLRITWTQPRVESYEYIYLYAGAAPAVGQPAGDSQYTWEYATAQPGGTGTEEASYYLLGSGPQTTLQNLASYGAAFVRYNSATSYVVAARATFLANQADWMANVRRNKPSWGALTLDKLFLPGSHDSGTFNMVDVGIPNVYNQTQSLGFAEQLDAGVRWVDFRVGYYPNYETGAEGPFFTVHADYGSWSAVSTALKVIKGWMDSHTGEIVFLNFKWEGPDGNTVWTDALRARVLQLAYDTLEPVGVLPRSEHAGMTVDEMFAKSYRAVLATSSSYNALTAPGSTTPPATGDPICPGVDYDWFDKYDVDDLIPELTASLSKSRTWMWAAGTVITPEPSQVGPAGGIPWGVWSLTMDGIDKVNGWIRGYASSLNVVPVDFVESSVALALVEEFNMARA